MISKSPGKFPLEKNSSLTHKNLPGWLSPFTDPHF